MSIYKTLIVLLISFTCVNCSKKDVISSTCFPHFGCVNYTSEWYDTKMRPENWEPLDRHVVNTKFLLLTVTPESNVIGYDPITSNPKNIKITPYEKHYALILLIHDFTSNGYTGWIKHMAIHISQLECYNTIAVDWQEGAEPPFLLAISNARIVAMEIQYLLLSLHENFQLLYSEVHIIGHGVGAHIGGYVGKLLNGKIGRITGLDPTGPCFEGMFPIVRLYHTDAMYVEVIHTDGAGRHHQGTLQPLGNMDFYFNNGSAQPGCRNCFTTMSLLDVQRHQLKEGLILPDCSHKRAFHYYIAALKDKTCAFLGLPMGTLTSAPLECGEPNSDSVPCATIGLDIDFKYYCQQVNTKYEIDTASSQPYCTNRYQIQIDIAMCPESDDEILGYFNMLMRDDEGVETNLTFNKNTHDAQVILQGKRLTFTAWTHNTAVETVTHLQVTWHFTTPFCFFCKNATCVERISITHVRSHVSTLNAPTSNHFCSTCSPEPPYTILYDQEPNSHFHRCQKDEE